MYKKILSAFLIFTLFCSPIISAEEIINTNSIQAVETQNTSKYHDYAKMFAGEDKYEKFNRKMFILNTQLNKFVAKPVHILWASIMPSFGMDRIRDAYNNIEYPKRLASCILQKDKKGIKDETVRFLTNTTLGIGGLFDPADKIFKIKPTNENMEQALCKCKMGSGSYLVMPCLNSCTPRSLCGRVLEAALDPCVYLAAPITSIIKFGLMLNRTSYMQPLAKMIESTYADPYDIHKKLFGIENYIKNSNYDRENFMEKYAENSNNEILKDSDNINSYNADNESALVNAKSANAMLYSTPSYDELLPFNEKNIIPDIQLSDYESQTPIVDSMKTALFENPDINKSFWNELSVWNHSFSKRIKTASVSINEGRNPYQFKYILQKNKSAPIVILYPSIGEGAGNHHSVVFAKMFYDEGYSVIMQGSHFHWEFVRSMPEGYAPGLPLKDSDYVRNVSSNILKYLENRYNCKFGDKYIVGTSFGAVMALFTASKESSDNTLDIKKYIAISPPIELFYALEQIDKNSESPINASSEAKNKTAKTAAKLMQVVDMKKDKKYASEILPFTDEEGKLITGFVLRQKLSDIIFTIENTPKDKVSDIYDVINNMSYKDYAEKYLGFVPENEDNMKTETSLFYLSDYLVNNSNYKIYQSLDDYFINKDQIAKLKSLAGEKLSCLSCGAHLGYLHRKEFIENLKSDF